MCQQMMLKRKKEKQKKITQEWAFSYMHSFIQHFFFPLQTLNFLFWIGV